MIHSTAQEARIMNYIRTTINDCDESAVSDVFSLNISDHELIYTQKKVSSLNIGPQA